MKKFDPSKLLPETISIVLSMMIYDTSVFCGRVYNLLGLKAHCYTDKTGKYFYAIVQDAINNRLFVIYRGTGGNNAWGRFLSWVTINLRLAQDKNGFHRGFMKIAAMSLAHILPYIANSANIYIGGHSQGGGVSVAALVLLLRDYAKKVKDAIISKKYFQADLFSAPPAVNKKGKSEVDGYLQNNFCRIFNWIESGDLISGKALRQKDGLFSGCDVGENIQLPNIIPDKYGLLDAVSHSPTVVLYAYKDMVPHAYDKELIDYVLDNKMIIN